MVAQRRWGVRLSYGGVPQKPSQYFAARTWHDKVLCYFFHNREKLVHASNQQTSKFEHMQLHLNQRLPFVQRTPYPCQPADIVAVSTSAHPVEPPTSKQSIVLGGQPNHQSSTRTKANTLLFHAALIYRCIQTPTTIHAGRTTPGASSFPKTTTNHRRTWIAV